VDYLFSHFLKQKINMKFIVKDSNGATLLEVDCVDVSQVIGTRQHKTCVVNVATDKLIVKETN
jgi:hypothetical protein